MNSREFYTPILFPKKIQTYPEISWLNTLNATLGKGFLIFRDFETGHNFKSLPFLSQQRQLHGTFNDAAAARPRNDGERCRGNHRRLVSPRMTPFLRDATFGHELHKCIGKMISICLFDAWKEVRNIPQIAMRKSSSLNTSKIKGSCWKKMESGKWYLVWLPELIKLTSSKTTNHQPTKKTMMSVRFFKHLTWTFYFPQ